ncbi:SusD/RagB family nutrient-binding outer membrane lipoprotein [Pedobacter cryophilus]|uniref:SusD/RagB family nutrient-binding outer membrane lipoprotein n=1 Tax=Pedobacter cryophilus TaxID=2571271 RepID=A0A4V5NWX0_9SPHI|nr:SusD/RagB family nutrient-binding outer membrane lipoprotein [Pedobacter cryophilus]TKB96690.1 SusD/RagB family nutrient-binding outer membrane lipoprotein [Pedobacter cryophilus]
MKKYIILLIATLGFASCNKDLSEINTNPNSPIDAQPSLLFRKVLFDYGEQMSFEGFDAGNLLGQYFTMIDFNNFDRHALAEPLYAGNPWPILFRNLRDNEIILQKANENNIFLVYKGPALVMKAYMTAALTDLYGDVPYSEALQGKFEIFSPKYDKQEDIYNGPNGILKNLENAITAMESYNGAAKLDGDIVYSGNLQNWIRFANSLRIKYLMRISDKVNVAAQLQSIYTNGKYIGANSQNAVFKFSASPPNNFRITTARAGDYNLYIMSKTAEEIFKNYNDPRISLFYRPTATNSVNFTGLQNGPDAASSPVTLANYSLTGRIFREDGVNLKYNYSTAWETNFFLAEAAQKGLITASAKALYDLGVTQGFEYWNVTMPTSYLTVGTAVFNPASADAIKQIITQKWIPNTINGYEGWIEYRRTGFPVLKPVLASRNNGIYPVRMPYPQEESTLNVDNYKTAATATNNNSINAKVWWDN